MTKAIIIASMICLTSKPVDPRALHVQKCWSHCWVECYPTIT